MSDLQRGQKPDERLRVRAASIAEGNALTQAEARQLTRFSSSFRSD